MRRHLLCLALLVLAAGLAVSLGARGAAADTIKMGGNVINETWTPAGSPYILQGDITVPVGSTLTIQAGTTVRAANSDSQAAGFDNARVELTVKGTLDVQGTAAMPVVFNGQAAGAGSWYGVVIDPLATAATINNASLDGTVNAIRYLSAGNVLSTSAVAITSASRKGVWLSAGSPTINGVSVATSGSGGADAAFYVDGNASPTLNNCQARSQSGQGVWFDDTTAGRTLSIVNCTIDRSTGYGVYSEASPGTVNIVSSIITNNGNAGVYRNDSSVVTVTYSDVWNNSGGNFLGGPTLGMGLVASNPLYVAMNNLRLTSNSPARFGAMGGGDMGALPYIADATVGVVGTQWTNRTFTAAGSPYTVAGDLTVGAGVTVTIEAGVTFNFANSDQMAAGADVARAELQVAGTLVADGTAAQPITLTSGNAAGSWYGVDVFTSAPGTVLDNVEIRNGVNGLTLRTAQPVTITATAINSASRKGVQILSDSATIGSVSVATSGSGGADAGIYLAGNASATISNCAIRGQSGQGVWFDDTTAGRTLNLVNCTIDRSTGYGVYSEASPGTVNITSSIITNNGNAGVYRNDSSAVTVSYSDVWNNSGGNFLGGPTIGMANLATNPLYVANNNLRLTDHSPARFGAMGGGDMGALPFIADATVGIVGTQWTNRTFTAAASPYTIAGDFTVAPGVTVILEPGVTFNFANSDQMAANTDVARAELLVAGTLVADGTAAAPITLTSGNAAGSWYGVDVFTGAGGTILDNAEIRNGVNGLTLRTPQAVTVTATSINSASRKGVQILSDSATIGSVSVATSGSGGADAGIYLAGNASATISNCAIRGQSGQGVWFDDTTAGRTLNLVNCTIDRSTGYGVYSEASPGTVNITNSIITNSGNAGVYRNDSSVVTVTYSDVWNNSGGNYLGGPTQGMGNLSQNPNYVAMNNLMLQGTSVCIDVGTSTGAPAVDFRAVSRPLDGDGIGGTGYDLGAYEFVLMAVCGNGAVEPGEMCDSGAQNGMYGACNGTCSGFGPRCGDSIMNGPEQCDDGNQSNTDACLDTCRTAGCGDGFIRAGVEACDDGNMIATDACTSACQVAACGDGFVRAGVEQCDDGNMMQTDACLNSCTPASCGDGFIRAGVEMCDDANLVNTDACPNTCQSARCGDGFVQIGVEQCDDGNMVDTDGCRNNCTSASCGDGNVGPGEACDDGNMSNTDACLNSCTAARCGDMFVRAGVEQCDDGNQIDTDACASCMNARCGDGFVLMGVEACDDGNLVDTDACRNNCAAAACGDGVVRMGVEACDDGNMSNTDACVFGCLVARCGDGFVQAGVEACDDANQVDTDACRNTCAAAVCGDGVIHAGVEDCDDGNMVNTDACTAACKVAACGDGIVHVGTEECDDGNMVQTDACINGCVAARCGDGVVRAGVEACDDGNTINNDACTNACVSSTCGDGVTQPGTETCDDANMVDTDACRNNCMQAVCGDGVIHAGVEACDDSNTVAGDGCGPTCQAEVLTPADGGGCCSTGAGGRETGVLGMLAVLFALRPRRRRGVTS